MSALYDDTQIIDVIVGLRSMELPNDIDQRAQSIQGSCNGLLALVATRKIRVKPAAKLKRIFSGLLPRELTCVLS